MLNHKTKENYRVTSKETRTKTVRVDRREKKGLLSLTDAMDHRPPDGQYEAGSLELATAVFYNMFEDCVSTTNLFQR